MSNPIFFNGDDDEFKVTSDKLVSDVELEKGQPTVLSQDKNNLLNQAVEGIRHFLGWDKVNNNDYIKLLGIMENKSDEDVYKELNEAGFTNAKTHHNAMAITGGFWNVATFGLYKDSDIVKTDSGALNSAMYVSKGVSELAGFMAADYLFKGSLSTLQLFANSKKIANIAEKLDMLKPYASRISDINPKAFSIKKALVSGANLGTLTALTNIIQSNERTNNVWEAIKDIEPEVLSNALMGAGIPVAGLVKSKVGKMAIALAIGELPRHYLTGQTSFGTLIQGLNNDDSEKITNSIFNMAMEMFFGLTAHDIKSPEAEDIKTGLKESSDFIGKINKMSGEKKDIIEKEIGDKKVNDDIEVHINKEPAVIKKEELPIKGAIKDVDTKVKDEDFKMADMLEYTANEQILPEALEDVLKKSKGLPEESRILWALAKNPKASYKTRMEAINRYEKFGMTTPDVINDVKKEIEDTKPETTIKAENTSDTALKTKTKLSSYPTFEEHLKKDKPEVIDNVIKLAKDDLKDWVGYSKTKDGLELKKGAKPDWLKGSKKDATKILKLLEKGNVSDEEERTLLNDILDSYGNRKDVDIPNKKDLYNEYTEKYKDKIDKYFEEQKEKYGEDTPYMFAGIPFKQGIDDLKKTLEKNSIEMSDKTINPLTYALVNPDKMDVFGTPQSKEIFKYLKKAVFNTEKIVEELRTPLSNIADETAGLFKTLKKEKEKYDYKQLEKDISKSIVEGDRQQRDPKEIFREINKQRLDEDTLKKVDTIFNKHKKFYEIGRKRIGDFVREQVDNMKNVVDAKTLNIYKKIIYPELHELENYMPRIREPGNVRVRIYNEDGKEIFMTQVTDVATGALKLVSKESKPRSIMAKRAIDKFFKEHPEINPNDVNIKTEYIKNDMDVSKFDMWDMLDFVNDILSETEISKEEKQQVITDAINKIRSKGFISHTIKRKEHIIYGYNEDPFDVMGKYLAQSTGFLQKQSMKFHLAEAYNQAQMIDDKLLQSYLRRFRDETLRNKDWVDKVVNQTRKWLFIKYLGLSLKNGFVNLTFQIPVVTAMHTSVEIANGAKANPVHFAKAEKLIAQVSEDLINKKLSDRELKIMNYLDRLGVTKDQKTQFMLGKSALLTGTWNKLLDATGIIMKVTEEANRKVSALTYLRLHPELNDEQLIEGARDFIYTTNGKYGDTELSILFQGKGSLARVTRVGQTFQTYVHQTILGAVKLMKEGQGTAVLMGTGMLLLMGGLSSTPFYGTIKTVYNTLSGRDLDLDMEKELGSDTIYHWLRGGLFANLPFNLSVDLSSSAGITLPTDELNYMGKDVSDKIMNMVFGVGYSSVKDMFKSLDYLKKGDLSKAIQYGLPARFLTYPVKALDEYYRGLTTTGDLMFVNPETGNPMALNETEALLQAVGFTPQRVSEFKNLYYTWENLRLYWTNRKTVLYNKMRVAKETGNKKLWVSSAKKIMEINRKMWEINRDYNLGLTPANVKSMKTVYSNRAFRNFAISVGGK